MDAVILAAGIGTRIKKITKSIPKVSLKLDRNNILDFQLKALKLIGIEEVVIVFDFRKEMIFSYLNHLNYNRAERLFMIRKKLLRGIMKL
jgi:choline kinase